MILPHSIFLPFSPVSIGGSQQKRIASYFFYSTEISSFVNLQNAQGLTLYLYRIDNIIIELVSL